MGGACQADFRENPGSRWVRRDGHVCHSQQSFAFEKVRAYKLALLREILAYRPDGIFFDWIRTGDVRDNPQTDATGVATYGYELPNIEAFQKKYQLDPRTLPNDDERLDPRPRRAADARLCARLQP